MTVLPPRSFLFVPASRPDFIAKAAGRGADAIILDLEDAVSEAERPEAIRRLPACVAALRQQGARVLVRVRSLDEGGRGDLAVAADADGIFLPKVNTSDDVAVAAADLPPRREIVAMIESAAGLLAASEIAAVASGLAFGGEDFCADLMIEPSEEALSGPAQAVVIASRAHGRPAYGLPGSLAGFADLDGFGRLAGRAARLGFTGAMAIHPTQVPVLNAAFAPSPAQVDHARRVIATAEKAGGGAVALDGKMIDRAVIARARKLLARAP